MLYAAQGCTAVNLYTPYGGTNHGSIGDPDTFCSYDYSACIRECGFVSLRYRLARIALYQLSACSDILCHADRDTAHPYVSCEPKSALYSVRVCSRSGARVFFVRNFDPTPQTMRVALTLRVGGSSVVSVLDLAHRACTSCVSGVRLPSSGIVVALSTLPLLLRIQRGDVDVLFLSAGAGGIMFEQPEGQQLAFHCDQPDMFSHNSSGGVVLLSPRANAVVTVRRSANPDESPQPACVVVCLSSADALTFTHDGGSSATWGPWHSRFDCDSVVSFALEPSLTIKRFAPQTLSVTQVDVDLSSGFAPALQLQQRLQQLEWQRMPNVWAMWPWRTATAPLNDLLLDAAAGHIVYRYTFSLSAAKAVTFKLSARHVANMWVNGRHVAHKVAYSNPWRLASVNQAAGLVSSILPSPLILKAGYSCGNDNPGRGSISVTVQPPVVHEGSNELIIVVDNLGHQRQALVHDDCRNPRGILSFSCSSSADVTGALWCYAAESCSGAANSIVTHGVPVDRVMQQLGAAAVGNWTQCAQPFRLESDGIHWLRASLSVPRAALEAEKFPVPIRLSVSGEPRADCVAYKF